MNKKSENSGRLWWAAKSPGQCINGARHGRWNVTEISAMLWKKGKSQIKYKPNTA